MEDCQEPGCDIGYVCPIHKRKALCDRKNYRGVHLTAQLSKVVERVLQVMWVPTLV